MDFIFYWGGYFDATEVISIINIDKIVNVWYNGIIAFGVANVTYAHLQEGVKNMIIWMGWFIISIFVMGTLGLRRYSISNRLVRGFVEIPAEQIRAYEGLCIIVEGFLVLSDESIWSNNTVLLLCGIAVLLVSQWILMRLALVITSGLHRSILERRLFSIRQSYRKRVRQEFK